jgi:hypothetical protein
MSGPRVVTEDFTPGPSRKESCSAVARSAVAKRAKVASGTVATPVVTIQQDAFHEFNVSRALELILRKCEMMGDALKCDMSHVETKAFQKRRELDDMIAELGTETDIAFGR